MSNLNDTRPHEYTSRNQLDMNWGHSDYNRNAKDESVKDNKTTSKAYVKFHQEEQR